VLCFEMGVKQGERLEAALATLLAFLRHEPEYQRTFGPPLDRDDTPSRVQLGGAGELSTAAQDVLAKLMERRRAASHRPAPPIRARNVLTKLLKRRRAQSKLGN
jgi:hypothetical protein